MKHTIPLPRDRFNRLLFRGVVEFTLLSTDTQKHYTFRVTKCPDVRCNTLHTPYFVRMFIEDENRFVFMGTIKQNNDGSRYYVHSWHKKKYKNEQGITAFKWALKYRRDLPEKLEIYHTGRCIVCGYRLKTDKSIENGIGPTCLKRLVDKDKNFKIYDKHLTMEA